MFVAGSRPGEGSEYRLYTTSLQSSLLSSLSGATRCWVWLAGSVSAIFSPRSDVLSGSAHVNLHPHLPLLFQKGGRFVLPHQEWKLGPGSSAA